MVIFPGMERVVHEGLHIDTEQRDEDRGRGQHDREGPDIVGSYSCGGQVARAGLCVKKITSYYIFK